MKVLPTGAGRMSPMIHAKSNHNLTPILTSTQGMIHITSSTGSMIMHLMSTGNHIMRHSTMKTYTPTQTLNTIHNNRTSLGIHTMNHTGINTHNTTPTQPTNTQYTQTHTTLPIPSTTLILSLTGSTTTTTSQHTTTTTSSTNHLMLSSTLDATITIRTRGITTEETSIIIMT